MALDGTLRRYLIHWLPVALWMALIFYLSAQTGLAPGNMVSSGFDWTLPFRSTAHFVLYFVLSILLQRALDGHKYSLGLTFLFSTIYAVSDEFHQSFVPGRGARAIDVTIDVIGAATALALVILGRSCAPLGRVFKWLNS